MVVTTVISLHRHRTCYHTPAQRSCWGVYWFHSVRPSVCPSVRPASRVRSVAPTVLVWFHIYTSYQSTSERVSRVTFLANFRIWIFKICYFDFTLFSLGIWCASLVWVITGRWWVSQNVSCQYKELWLTCFLSIKDIDRTILKYIRCQRLSWSKQGGGGGDNDTRRYNLVRETHFMYSWLKVMYKHYSPTFASYHAMYTLRKITHINISWVIRVTNSSVMHVMCIISESTSARGQNMRSQCIITEQSRYSWLHYHTET